MRYEAAHEWGTQDGFVGGPPAMDGAPEMGSWVGHPPVFLNGTAPAFSLQRNADRVVPLEWTSGRSGLSKLLVPGRAGVLRITKVRRADPTHAR